MSRFVAWFRARPDRGISAALAVAITLVMLGSRTRLAPPALSFLCDRRWTRLQLAAVVVLTIAAVALPAGLLDRRLRSAWDSRRAIARRATLVFLKSATFAVMFVVSLKVVDVAASLVFTGRFVVVGDFDLEPPARHFSLHPYTGFHVPAHRHYRGPMPYEGEGEYEVQSGERGFWVDFELEHPPPKAPREFRIVLIGGSAAQGWGGTRQDRMFYRLLERNLQERFGPRGVPVRVVNMAMGGSITYQNFVALNLWGHALEPDMILSFSGGNDLTVPLTNEGSEAYFGFFRALAAVESADIYESPPWLKSFYRAFPSLVAVDSQGTVTERTPLGNAVRSRASSEARSRERYLATTRVKVEEAARRGEDFYVHALRSIERDFPGVPIVVALQPYDHPTLGETYERFIAGVRAQLEADHELSFVDVHRVFKERGLFDRDHPLAARVHLNDKLHGVVADVLTEATASLIAKRRHVE